MMKCDVCKRKNFQRLYFFEDDIEKRMLCLDCLNEIIERLNVKLSRQLLEVDNDD